MKRPYVLPFPIVGLLLLVLLLRVRGTFAVDEKAGNTSRPKVSLGKPNYSHAFEASLQSNESRTVAGSSNLVAFSFTSLSTSPPTDEQEAKEGFVNVYDRFSPGSDHPIYNLALDDKLFPSSGHVECFDENGNWIASLSPLSSKKPRNASAGDWRQIPADGRTVGVLFRVRTNPTKTVQDENGLSLGPGKYRFQAVLLRRFWTSDIVDKARLTTARTRHLTRYGFDKLDPQAPDYAERKKELEQQVQNDRANKVKVPPITPQDEDFKANIDVELKRLLDPMYDEVRFHSNVLELEVVAR